MILADILGETRKLCPLWDRIHVFFTKADGGSVHLQQGTGRGKDATMQLLLNNDGPTQAESSNSGSKTDDSDNLESSVEGVLPTQPNHQQNKMSLDAVEATRV